MSVLGLPRLCVCPADTTRLRVLEGSQLAPLSLSFRPQANHPSSLDLVSQIPEPVSSNYRKQQWSEGLAEQTILNQRCLGRLQNIFFLPT